jgi:hypothetical protein
MNWSNIAMKGAAGCWLVLAQLPTPGGSEFLAVVGALIVIATAVRLYYDIMAGRRKANESYEPKRTILPSPLQTKSVHDFVTQPEFEKLDEEIDRKFEKIYEHIEKKVQHIETRHNAVLAKLERLIGRYDESRGRTSNE